MNVKAPKAPPTMGPIGTFESDFPCTKTVTTPGAAADVGLNEEDFRVEEDSSVNNIDEGGSCDEGRVGRVSVVIMAVEVGTKAVVNGEVIEIQVVQKK